MANQTATGSCNSIASLPKASMISLVLSKKALVKCDNGGFSVEIEGELVFSNCGSTLALYAGNGISCSMVTSRGTKMKRS